MREGLELIARGLRVYASVPTSEFITRLLGERTREDALGVIAEAERIGLIKPAEMVVGPTTTLQKRWRLARGFDLGRLGISA